MRDKPKPTLRDSLKRKPQLLTKPLTKPDQAFDAKRSRRSTRAANDAADRLLREMDEFLKQAGRTKP